MNSKHFEVTSKRFEMVSKTAEEIAIHTEVMENQ